MGQVLNETRYGQVMGNAFLDELGAIKHAMAEDPGRQEDGLPGTQEFVMGQQMQVERSAEEHRSVGNPQSDRMQRILSIMQVPKVKTAAEEKKRPYQTPGAGAVRGGALGAAAGGLYGAGARKAILAGRGKVPLGLRWLAHGIPLRTAARGAAVGALAGGVIGGARTVVRKLKGQKKTSALNWARVAQKLKALPSKAKRLLAAAKSGRLHAEAVKGRAFRKDPLGQGLGAMAKALKKGKGQIKTSAISERKYTKYFKNKMNMRGVTSLTQLTGEQKKKFFEHVDKGWHSSREKLEGLHTD